MFKNNKTNLTFPDTDLESILESTPGYVYWKNLDSIYLGCNQNFTNLLGMNIVGKSEYEMPWASPGIADHNVKADRYVIETGKSWVTEEEVGIRNEEGFSIIFRSEKRPLKDRNGKVVGILGVSLDITKQKVSENSLTDIDLIIDSFPGYVYWKDLKSVYRGCNQTFAAMVDFRSTDEMSNKTDYEMFSPDIASKYVNDDQYVIKTGKVLVVEDRTGIKNSKGLEIFVRTEKKPFFDKQGAICGILGLAVDITEEVNFKKSEIDRDLILSATPGFVYWKNIDSVYIGCNHDFLQIALTDNVNDVIGKTDYTLPWGAEPGIAAKFVNDDRYVIKTGNTIVAEDNLVIKNSRGLTVIVRTEKKPLYDKQGNIIGVLGIAIDITDQKEAEHLRRENQAQSAIAQEQAKFKKVADQVAHDIRSPLASLLMIVKACQTIPERERVALREAATTIDDIANNLLRTYQKKEAHQVCTIEEPEPTLVSPLMLQILTDKKYQFQNIAIKFIHQFSARGNFSWIMLEPTAFKRMLSNIINNSVDALDKKEGEIVLHLDADHDQVHITIEDNGKGMQPELVQKIMNHIAVTDGKENGHGIGLTQVRETLQNNHGKWTLESQVGVGTKVKLSFAKTEPRYWIASSIRLNDDDIVTILDDDGSIHLAWDTRFDPILKKYPHLKVKHFEVAKDAIDFITDLPPNKKQKVFLLTDYELLKQDLNGIDVIKNTSIARSTLVTSHYASKLVQYEATKAGTKILPKQLASDVPIQILPSHAELNSQIMLSDLQKVDAVFVDDDQHLLDSFTFFAFNKKVDTYHDPQHFLDNAHLYHKSTKIMLDYHFMNSDHKGVQIAKQLHDLGFTQLYLLSGESFPQTHIPEYLNVIMKTDLDKVKTILNT